MVLLFKCTEMNGPGLSASLLFLKIFSMQTETQSVGIDDLTLAGVFLTLTFKPSPRSIVCLPIRFLPHPFGATYDFFAA